jgi:hypothetical protein
MLLSDRKLKQAGIRHRNSRQGRRRDTFWYVTESVVLGKTNDYLVEQAINYVASQPDGESVVPV